jgi:hypothetical protein
VDEQGFDRLVKGLANGANRRRIVQWAIAAIAGGVSGGIGSARAQPCGGSSSFCGGSNPPCCAPLQCVGPSGLLTCQPCAGAGSFCGGSNPSCCAGYQCTGPSGLQTCEGTGGSWGDPHLITFNGLLYDFQASGDFVLAQRDPDFMVQGRQVSLAPTSPEVAVNIAVATRMSKLVVAICAGETPLSVDGQSVDLGDGEAVSLPDGVTVSRSGNRYFVTSPSGDSVSATLLTTSGGFNYLDVGVGLDPESGDIGGLLASTDDPIGITASDGTVFTSPFSFDDLYQHYGDSWRVKPSESLLTVCGAVKEQGIPTRPFSPEDLDPADAERARDVCTKAEMTAGLLDACILDVAVMGDQAVEAYAGRPSPNHVGMVVL